MRLFKDVKGNNVDPVNHTLSILKEYPYAKIHIGNVLDIFFGSANLKRSNPDATTPVELPNSIKLFSNQ